MKIHPNKIKETTQKTISTRKCRVQKPTHKKYNKEITRTCPKITFKKELYSINQLLPLDNVLKTRYLNLF